MAQQAVWAPMKNSPCVRASLSLSLVLSLASCGSGSDEAADPDPSKGLGAALAKALVDACPMAAPDDQSARQACADALTVGPLLRERMSDPFDWGGQKSTDTLDLDKSNRTDFNPRIWRRLYLSTFMFTGEHSEQKAGDTVIIRLPVSFRNQLDPGSFPYPFWHSADKWTSYETTREILFFLHEGKLVGALRSADRDPARPHRDMKWDGRWTWEDSNGQEPRVSLYSFAFSPGNPYVAELETAYRTMERELRKETCLSCHSPDNIAKMNPLELFSYPNQALSGRKQLVAILKANLMPPAAPGGKPGIPDDGVRVSLVELARKFQELGDQALAFEGEPAP